MTNDPATAEAAVRQSIFEEIVAELVCCMPGEETHTAERHAICYWSYCAARLADPSGHRRHTRQPSTARACRTCQHEHGSSDIAYTCPHCDCRT